MYDFPVSFHAVCRLAQSHTFPAPCSLMFPCATRSLIQSPRNQLWHTSPYCIRTGNIAGNISYNTETWPRSYCFFSFIIADLGTAIEVAAVPLYCKCIIVVSNITARVGSRLGRGSDLGAVEWPTIHLLRKDEYVGLAAAMHMRKQEGTTSRQLEVETRGGEERQGNFVAVAHGDTTFRRLATLYYLGMIDDG
jgi:hypothetical protein